MKYDPLSERVHPSKAAFVWTGLIGAAQGAIARARGEGRARARRGERRMSAPAPSLPAPRGSSFYVAMRVLPQEKRQAMFDIYGFCRAVDDIADDCARAREPRHAELQAWRADVDAVFAGRSAAGARGARADDSNL